MEAGRHEGRLDNLRVEDRLIPLYGEDLPPTPDPILELPVDLASWVESRSTDEAGGLVETAESELFTGSTWPYLGDHSLIVAFGSRCPDPDAPVGAWAGIAWHRKEDRLFRIDRLLNPFFEDNFNVGRQRFRGTSLWNEPQAPLKGIPKEVLLSTSNARFAYDHTRMLASQLLSMNLEHPNPEELKKIQEWTEEARAWQRRIRGLR
jgi:hypothetical protein